MPGILILSSAGLTDRILAHTNALPMLAEQAPVHLWACSASNAAFEPMWRSVAAKVERFPEIRNASFGVNYLRRLNEFAWDHVLRDPSRLSMQRHIRDTTQGWYVRGLRGPAKLIAAAGLHQRLEKRIERMMTGQERSVEATRRLHELQPDLVFSTGTFRYEEPAVVASARRMKIPVAALITSWDNISIKGRMVLPYDAYFVWSERMKQELQAYYPQSREAPVYIVGAPQFDVFFQRHRYVSRQEFCESHGLRADRPVIVHAMGVANGIDEQNGAFELARRVAAGDLGNAQLIVRPHPFQHETELRQRFAAFGPHVVFQQQGDPNQKRSLRSQDEAGINQWVNTFRHADVVVHLYSTVAIDAAIFDRPCVGMDYDPQPGEPARQLVKEVNHVWTHYKPVAESGGMRLADNLDEMIAAIKMYLENPSLHRAERRKMAEYVCGYLDGRCGERMAESLLQLLSHADRSQFSLRPACV